MNYEEAVEAVCKRIAKELASKNNAYGNSALKPSRVFSNLEATDGILLRMDDKLSRITKGDGSGNEDAAWDLLGYAILYVACGLGFEGRDPNGTLAISNAVNLVRHNTPDAESITVEEPKAFSRGATDIMWLGRRIDNRIRTIGCAYPMSHAAAGVLAGELVAWHALKLMCFEPAPAPESEDGVLSDWESSAELCIQYLGSDEELTPKGLMDAVIESSDELDRWRELGRDFTKSLGIEPLDDLTPEYVFVLASNARDNLRALRKQLDELRDVPGVSGETYVQKTRLRQDATDQYHESKCLDMASAMAEQDRSRKDVDQKVAKEFLAIKALCTNKKEPA